MAEDSDLALRQRQAKAKLAAQGQSAAPQQGPGFVQWAAKNADDIARSLASGASFGLADEFAAFMSDLTGIGGQAEGDYSEKLAAERARDEAIPGYVKVPGETAGAVGASIAAAPATGAALATKGIAQLPAWAKAAGIGGVTGGLFGFGTSEGGTEERAKGAATGAAIGTAAGAATYPIIRGAEKLAGGVSRAVRERFNPESGARRAIAKAIGQDEMTPAKVAARLRQLGPQATVADAGGENLLGVTRGATGMPGPAKNRASMVLSQRAEREGERIGKALGKLKPKDYFAAEDQFVERLRSRAAPLYEEAYKKYQQIASKEVDRVLDTPAGRKALGRAVQKMQNDMTLVGKADPELTAALREAVDLGKSDIVTGRGVARGLKLRTLDYVKRSLDDMIGAAQKGGERDEARILVGLKNKLLGELDEATGGVNSVYAKARKFYSDDIQVLDALEKGREFLRQDREIIRRELGKLSDSAKEAYRSGAVRSLMDRVMGTADQASAARRIFGNSLLRGKIRELFPDEKAFNGFARTMIAEGQFAKTKNAILSGSRTTPMAEEVKGLRSTLGNLGAVMGSDIPMAGHALVRSGIGRRLAEGVVGAPVPEYNQALARLLLSRNQPANQGLMDALRKTAVPARPQPDPLVQALMFGAGQQAGQAGSR